MGRELRAVDCLTLSAGGIRVSDNDEDDRRG